MKKRKSRTPQLKKVDARRFVGEYYEYVAIRNLSSGKKNVYDAFVLSTDDPVTFGREIPLALVRDLIVEIEDEVEASRMTHSFIWTRQGVAMHVKRMLKERRQRFAKR